MTALQEVQIGSYHPRGLGKPWGTHEAFPMPVIAFLYLPTLCFDGALSMETPLEMQTSWDSV